MSKTIYKYNDYINRNAGNKNNIFVQVSDAEKRFGGKVPVIKSRPVLSQYGLPENAHQIIEDAKASKMKRFREEDDRRFKRAIPIFLVVGVITDLLFSYFTGWSIAWSISPAFLIGIIITGIINCYITEKREKPIREITIPYEENYQRYESDLLAYDYWKSIKNIQYWDRLDGHSFEHKVADVYKKFGYTATVSKAGGDGGIDIELSKNGDNIAVQCKAHNKAVGPAVARDLYGTMVSLGYKKGIIVSKNGFTKGVHEFVSGKAIELVDLDGILKMVQYIEDNSL